MLDDTLFPVHIRTLGDKIFQGDRLQLGVYCLLVEEEFNEVVEYGIFEFSRFGSTKPVLFDLSLRSDVLDAVNAMENIVKGEIPDICHHGALCGRSCLFSCHD